VSYLQAERLKDQDRFTGTQGFQRCGKEMPRSRQGQEMQVWTQEEQLQMPQEAPW